MALTITNSGSAGGGSKKYVDADGNLFIKDVSFKETLNDNPWGTIQIASQLGVAQDIWAVGDVKEIELNGMVSRYEEYPVSVYILGFNHNPDYEEPGITFGLAKSDLEDQIDICLIDDYYDVEPESSFNVVYSMKHLVTYSNGGWKGSDIRYDILGSTNIQPKNYSTSRYTDVEGYDPVDYDIINSPIPHTLLAAFPQDLRSVIKPNMKYTNNLPNGSNAISSSVDYLWLLSEYEIFGSITNASPLEAEKQSQYQYYIDGNSAIKFTDQDWYSESIWWTRSPVPSVQASSSSAIILSETWCCVGADGVSTQQAPNYSYGLAPAFLV